MNISSHRVNKTLVGALLLFLIAMGAQLMLPRSPTRGWIKIVAGIGMGLPALLKLDPRMPWTQGLTVVFIAMLLGRNDVWPSAPDWIDEALFAVIFMSLIWSSIKMRERDQGLESGPT